MADTFMDTLRHLGHIVNHESFAFIWAVVGLLCSMMAVAVPTVIKNESSMFVVRPIVGIGVCAVYYLAWRVREKDFLRIRTRWHVTILCNSIMTILASVISMKMEVAVDPIHNIQFWLFVSGGVFGLIEVSKVIFDFGLLLYIVRIPWHLTLAHFGPNFSKYYVVVGLVVLVIHMWVPTFLWLFNEEWDERQRVEVEKRRPMELYMEEQRRREEQEAEERKRRREGGEFDRPGKESTGFQS